MNTTLPVLNIGHFNARPDPTDFYVETLSRHVKEHQITARPHRHDFFLVLLFTKGKGLHEIDFTQHHMTPGSLFILRPGQSHHWHLSSDAEGIIFFHTREFFDSAYAGRSLRDYPFFNSAYNSPLLHLTRGQLLLVAGLFKQLLVEYRQQKKFKRQKLLNLVDLLYIEMARAYAPAQLVKSEQYLARVEQFEDRLDAEFQRIKLPSQYAAKMGITERHLNRICQSSLGKTPSAMILDRTMLEAKRLLMRDGAIISEIAAELGYPDAAYFSRLFKKQSGKTPREFMKGY